MSSWAGEALEAAAALAGKELDKEAAEGVLATLSALEPAAGPLERIGRAKLSSARYALLGGGDADAVTKAVVGEDLDGILDELHRSTEEAIRQHDLEKDWAAVLEAAGEAGLVALEIALGLILRVAKS